MERDVDGNVIRKEHFEQVCVWPGTILDKEKVSEFEAFMAEEFGARVQYLENIPTNPDLKDVRGVLCPVEGTGGRDDLFFAVHSDDIGKFAIPRLSVGIRWIEDVYGNCQGYLYPVRVSNYKTW
jgi:hypothetical protein